MPLHIIRSGDRAAGAPRQCLAWQSRHDMADVRLARRDVVGQIHSPSSTPLTQKQKLVAMRRPERYHNEFTSEQVGGQETFAEQAGRARDMAAVHLAGRDMVGQVQNEGVRGRGEHPPIALVCGHAQHVHLGDR